MALQDFGPISADNIRTEFGATNGTSVSFGDYRISENVGTLEDLQLDTGVPKSGPVSFSDFYSKKLNIVVDLTTISDLSTRINARSVYNLNSTPIRVIGGFKSKPANSEGSKVYINTNTRIGSQVGNVNLVALRTGIWNANTDLIMEIGSSAKIYGGGGNGGNASYSAGATSGDPGSSALGIEYPTTIINRGYLQAGYGGGGGGGSIGRNVNTGKKGKKSRFSVSVGGGGGGGAGYPFSIGGISAAEAEGFGVNGSNGGNGGLETFGYGGAGGQYAGNGGNGGGPVSGSITRVLSTGTIFTKSGSTFTQTSTIQDPVLLNTGLVGFGNTIKLSRDKLYSINGSPNDQFENAALNSGQASLLSITYTPTGNIDTIDLVGIVTGFPYAVDADDNFGAAVAINQNGTSFVVGAPKDEFPGNSSSSGVAYVFDRSGTTLTRVGILTASTEVIAQFGASAAMNDSGNLIAIGAPYSSISPNETSSGVVYIYSRTGNTFTQIQIITGSDATTIDDNFGYYIEFSGDGNTLVVGAPNDENGVTGSGVVYVFTRTGGVFNQSQILTGLNISGNPLPNGSLFGDTFAVTSDLSGSATSIAIRTSQLITSVSQSPESGSPSSNGNSGGSAGANGYYLIYLNDDVLALSSFTNIFPAKVIGEVTTSTVL